MEILQALQLNVWLLYVSALFVNIILYESWFVRLTSWGMFFFIIFCLYLYIEIYIYLNEISWYMNSLFSIFLFISISEIIF